MKKFLPLLLFIFFLPFSGVTQNYRRSRYHSYHHHHYYNFGTHHNFSDGDLDQDDWILCASSSQYINNSFAVKNAYGLSAEYLFADNWSIRGGIYINSDFCHFTPAPLGILFLKWEANHPSSYRRDDGRAILYSLISLAMNDGIGYNFPIGNRMHLMPYFGTWQTEFQFLGPDLPPKERDLCSMGFNFKYQFAGNWLLSADAEYDRTVWFADSRSGFRLNFSLGYKIH